jgi:DNA-binding GntR family transcriptional regulator
MKLKSDLADKKTVKIPKDLVHVAYEKIKGMMLDYEIVPGQRLVFIDLAEKLGVSRTPVNIALSVLFREGFLDFAPNQGYRVHEITLKEANDLYDLREILEMGAIDQAIRLSTPGTLEKLKEQKRLYDRSVIEQVTRGRFALDQEFHASYIDMAGNPYLTEYFREVYQRIFLRHRIEGLPANRTQKVVLEHQEIFEAVSIGDAKNARLFIRKHIRAGKDYIFSSIFP